MNKSLLVVLAHDIALFFAVVLYFWLDTGRLGFVGTLLPLAFVLVLVISTKTIKKFSADLTPKQKRTRFSVTATSFVLLIGLVVYWAVRKNNSVAWVFASLGIIILAALFYAEWDRLNEELKKTASEPENAGTEANKPPLRMPVSGTPAADAPVAPPPGIAGR